MGRRWKRQILLFLLAVLLPAAVLVTLAVRLVRQETELAAKRVEAARREASEELRRELSARLDAIKLAFAADARSDPPIVFVARLEQDRVVLPWEDRQPRSRPLPALSALQHQAEEEEFLRNDPAAAAIAYRKAAAAAQSEFDKCQSRLRLGRVLYKAGDEAASARTLTPMITECRAVTDDDGVAFAFYAAELLAQCDGPPAALARAYASEEAGSPEAKSLIEAYLLRSLLERMKGLEPSLAEQLLADIRDKEQMSALAHDFHAPLFRMEFTVGARPGDSAWLAYGDEAWLITILSPAPLTTPVVVAVSANKLAPAGVKLVAGHSQNSVRVGEGLLNLEVEWPPDRFVTAGQGMPASLYGAGIALILSTTILAAYLLLRDVIREAQIAEMRSLFVASVSHELKTPLTAIRMFAETLGKERPPDDTRRTDYARTIVNESERLSRLVDNLLDSSRIEYGEKIYRKKRVWPADVVRSAADAMQYPLAQKGFELRLTIEDGLPPILADADAMEQAILNLLTNAMKYSGNSRSIHLNLKRSGDDVLIEVIDRGLGIDAAEQVRIFDRFYRVRSETTDRITGAGLGLTLVRHIVDAHGGRLDLASEPGQGSTFSVRIPAVPA
jgi:signal transduction histidine kinase